MPSKSSRKRRSRKAADRPKKPYPDFPLSPHASGAWQKKIRGKIHYFGKWGRVVNGKLERIEGDGWEEALDLYKAQADDLHAGRTPRVNRDGLTVKDLCNRFLTAKHHKHSSGELGPRMYQEYQDTTDLLVAAFGKDRFVDDLVSDDFEKLRADMAERWGPVRLGNAITRVKSVFKYGLDNGLIEKAIRYGSEFKKPDKAVLQRHRAKNGERMLEAGELRRVLDALAGKEVETGRTDEETGKPETVSLKPNPTLRAMILLGVNAGFGNHDVATLPLTALDLDRGFIDFPRPKTGIGRRCPLWSETVAAIREALAERPSPKHKADANIVFLQSSGRRWVRNTEKSRTDNVSLHFTNLLKMLGLHHDRIGFYTLRHVFRTVADAARDPVAIDLIMGHSDPSMGGHYRERIEDSRLRAVADHVRRWLFGETPAGGPDGTDREISDPSDPCALDDSEGGPEGAQGSQESEPVLSADEWPTLRLYVG
jgi:integrase